MTHSKKPICQYARLLPRELFNYRDGKRGIVKDLDFLAKPGVYVLYCDERPYYVGKASKLRSRLRIHANKPGSKYYNFWTHFSVFVIEDKSLLNHFEGVLIAAMPTANGARPKFPKVTLPPKLQKFIHERAYKPIQFKSAKAGQ